MTEQLAFDYHKQKAKHSAIAGKVFVPIGADPKFCFDEDQPYIDLKEAVEGDKVNWILNDGSPVPYRLDFEKECFFDKESRTFHGKILWPVTFRGAYQWDIVLAFKKSFEVMHVGIIHERKERVVDEALLKDKTAKEIIRLQYPFDGAWKLTWKNFEDEENTAKVTIRNNQFQQGPYLFNLNMSNPKKVFFRWPLDPVTADVTSGGNLRKKPMGPEIGEVVSWKTKHPAFPEGFKWERETFGEMPVQGTLHFGVGGNEYIERSVKEVVSVPNDTDIDVEDSETGPETDFGESSNLLDYEDSETVSETDFGESLNFLEYEDDEAPDLMASAELTFNSILDGVQFHHRSILQS